ncbi:hypothetical protein [Catenovulum sediminis]|uniref:hypothetical protein n=1 Tax=Catenovulum sediminis TaxID=1740262 RepID=UPI001180318A|nr:hypothetical protein [Catenovulum sediminis]
MIRLSRAGWNNVLIFASLIMIFLFNGLHMNFGQQAASDKQNIAVLPANQHILTIDFPGYSIERVGRDWRIVAAEHIPLQAQNVVQAWQALSATVVAQDDNFLQPYLPDAVIVFWFADSPQGYVIQWFNLPSGSFLKTPDNLLQVDESRFSELVYLSRPLEN